MQTVRRKWETSGVVDNSVFDSFTLRGLSTFPAGRDDSDKRRLIARADGVGETERCYNTELNFRLHDERLA